MVDAGDVYTWGWNESGQLGCCTSTKRQRGNNAGPEDEGNCTKIYL